MQQTEFARRLPGSGSLRDTPPPTSSLPGTRRGGGEGCQRLQHLPRRLAARGAYFPSRYSEQVSLSLGKARRRQPICRQRRALPERCRAAGAVPRSRSRGTREGARARGISTGFHRARWGDGTGQLAPETAPPCGCGRWMLPCAAAVGLFLKGSTSRWSVFFRKIRHL